MKKSIFCAFEDQTCGFPCHKGPVYDEFPVKKSKGYGSAEFEDDGNGYDGADGGYSKVKPKDGYEDKKEKDVYEDKKEKDGKECREPVKVVVKIVPSFHCHEKEEPCCDKPEPCFCKPLPRCCYKTKKTCCCKPEIYYVEPRTCCCKPVPRCCYKKQCCCDDDC